MADLPDDETSGHRARLAREMDERGAWPARSGWIRDAVDAVPRHTFAPERLWRWDGHAYVPVDRATDPDAWAAQVYGGPYDAAVTQVTDGRASSSLSCQAVVVDMLDSLLLEPGHRVLELGTGTGWNAALAAHRAGPGRVTSVEVDAGLAESARVRLAAAGAEVRVVVADGARGHRAGGPYDRVVATYAVERVPWEWIAQTRAGGRIVTPWGRLGHVALTVAEDGCGATGWVQGLAEFMPAREGADGAAGAALRSFAAVRGDGPPEDVREFERALDPLRDDTDLRFALRVALPEVRVRTGVDADGVNAWLHDGGASWASLSSTGDGRTVAYQGGPRRLADEVAAAWDRWLGFGSPAVYDFGMTVTATDQYVWLNDPASGPRWGADGTVRRRS